MTKDSCDYISFNKPNIILKDNLKGFGFNL
ncbi:enolase [Francisella opportunistica]|uniref:Enolase n=1 Tax=Francisella opportunistica TaxID=2016517 RepID=A0A345JRJ2_9GAMM|nr:enolase [Francisella opportunistica]